MSAPRLNRALMLEAPVEAPDGAGGVTEGWVALGTLWAAVAPRTGRETSGAAGALATTAHRITVRAAPHGCEARPRPGQRFREDTRVWRILAVAEADPEGRYLTCFAEEELAP